MLALAERQRQALGGGDLEKAFSLQKCRDRLVGVMRGRFLHVSSDPSQEDRGQVDFLVRRISQVDSEIRGLIKGELERLQGRIHQIHRIRSLLRGGFPRLFPGKGVHVTA
jgi:hypothetical protein